MNASPEASLAALTSWYRRPGERLVVGRAQLFDDHIVCTEWRLKGRTQFRIDLDAITGVDCRVGMPQGANLRIRGGASDEPFVIRIGQAGLWKFELEARCGQLGEGRSALPPDLRRMPAARGLGSAA